MKNTIVEEQVSSLTSIIRELVRDAMGTTTVPAMLDIVHLIETHLYGLKSWGEHACFKVWVGTSDIVLVGGNIINCKQMTWDVYAYGFRLQDHSDYEHLGKSEWLTTPKMLQLLLKVAAV